jgi:CubicO group peptidase (beta-lactamase class C family)
VGSGREVSQEIDRVLRDAVGAREVPGVVALAASDRGSIYQGAFGVRDLAAGGAMTLDTVFRRLDDQSDHLGRGDAAR